MIHICPENIEKYAAEHGVQESALLKALARETTAKAQYPQMMVGPLEGAFLRTLVRLTGAKRILEIGTFTGYSALTMAEALPENGRIITCDINPSTTLIAQRYWAQSPHGKKIELKLGPAVETLKTLKGPFDLVFIDADKPNYAKYWDASLPKIRKGGALAVDNVLWGGAVLNPGEDSAKSINAFNRKVAADKRVECMMVTIRDGVTLAWKK